MRYSVTENTYLVGQFLPGRTVTIKVLNLSNDVLLSIRTDVCVESKAIPGIYIWSTGNITTPITTMTSLIYVMTSKEDGRTYIGKLVYGGLIEELNEINKTNEISEISEELASIAEDVRFVKLMQ
jgi:hypothetical protein